MSIDTSKPLPCFKCGQQLKPAMDDYPRMPAGGMLFKSHGNFGSTVFDDARGHWVEIVICDDCVQAAVGTGTIVYASPRRMRPPEPTYVEFDPEKH